MTTWQEFGIGAMLTYELTLNADATATELPGYSEYAGTYLLPVKYHSSADAALVLTLEDANAVDYLNGQGTVADATTGGFISPTDRWPIANKLYYTLTGLGAGTVTFTFHVSKDR